MPVGQNGQKQSFHDRDDRGHGAISTWLQQEVSQAAQGRLDFVLDQLSQLPAQDWGRPIASALGNHTYVIRFKEVGGGQMRIFGHFCTHHQAFVMTFNGYEKDNVYYPRDFAKRAVRHQNKCKENPTKFSIPFRDRCGTCTPVVRHQAGVIAPEGRC